MADTTDLQPLADELIDELRQRRQTISFCESLTAGLACATVAAVPGASDVLRGGLVVYSTELKVSLAHVSADVIETHGPVSPVTARDMARGTRSQCGSDWSVATTGVAGPDAQDGHPVGEVWIGVAGPKWTASTAVATLVPEHHGKFALIEGLAEPVRVVAGTRAHIQHASVEAALLAVLRGVREQKNDSER